MNRILFLLLFVFLLASTAWAESDDSLPEVPSENRYALLIGVGKYPNADLPSLSAVKDMTDLADALEKYAGFPRKNITMLTDDSPEDMKPTNVNIVVQVKKVLKKLKEDDLLIVAFSGHGVAIKISENDLSPCLCVRNTEFSDLGTFVSRRWLYEQIDKCDAKRKIFFCDMCRTEHTREQLAELVKPNSKSTAKSIYVRPIKESTKKKWDYKYVLMSSCSEDQISIDAGSNGLFTKYLLEGLQTGNAALRDGDLTVSSWFEYACKKTEEASVDLIKKYPYLVKGNESQTRQTPRIEYKGEMSRFVIAKLAPAGLDVAIPQNVEDVEIRQYQVGGLQIELTPMGQTTPGAAIQAGKIQLPPVPEKINELTGILRGIDDALARMEAGTHEALKEANLAKTAAQKQYLDLKARRDEEWNVLPPDVQSSLEKKIKQSPTAKPTTLASLRPKEVGFSQFIKQVLWGQKTEQALLEQKRVEQAVADAIAAEISRVKQAKTDRTAELAKETENFCRTVVEFLLTKSPGWDSKNTGAELDYMFLADTIPALLKYPFKWEEGSLFALAEEIWANNRPCVVEMKEKQRQAEAEKKRLAEEKKRKEEAEKQRIAEQRRLEEANRKAGTRKVFTVDGIEYAFRWCPPGEFMMGSPSNEPDRYDDEGPQHKVRLTRGFWLLETEVTQAMWESVMGENPSSFKGAKNPVEQVSWAECQEFCRKLGQKLGQQVQLPTEAQWEYACRAGTSGAYAGNLDEMCWYEDNSGSKTHAVGLKKPNAWGLSDMHGNVWEWCSDWFDNYAESPTSDPTGPTSGTYRVDRGGGWRSSASDCRSAIRSGSDPVLRLSDLGLRLLVVPVQ